MNYLSFQEKPGRFRSSELWRVARPIDIGSVSSLVNLEPKVCCLRHGHRRGGRRRRGGRCRRGRRGVVAGRGHSRGGGPRAQRRRHHPLYLRRIAHFLLVLFLPLLRGGMTKFRRIRTLAKCAKAGTARTFPPPSSFRLSFLVLVPSSDVDQSDLRPNVVLLRDFTF